MNERDHVGLFITFGVSSYHGSVRYALSIIWTFRSMTKLFVEVPQWAQHLTTTEAVNWDCPFIQLVRVLLWLVEPLRF